MAGDDKHRTIGTVTSVSADKLQVELLRGLDGFTVVGADDMQQIARLNSYVLIPVQTDYVVGEVIDIRQRDVMTDKQRDSDIELSKADSAKFLDVVPLGMMDREGKKFEFGVSNYPPLYADVLYALDGDLRCLFNSDKTETNLAETILIGHSASGGNYETRVNTNKFFGGHVAVLGNTGSGKSCTVASILQSIFTRQKDPKAKNARFIIFDVNGEYKQALNSCELPDGILVDTIELDGTDGDQKFTLPHWLLTVEEWELLLQASEKTQRPILRSALALSSLIGDAESQETIAIREHFVATCIREVFRGGDGAVGQMRQVNQLFSKFGTNKLNVSLLQKHRYDSKFGNFPQDEEEKFLKTISDSINPEFDLGYYKHTSFNFSDFKSFLELAILFEQANGNKQVRDYCAPLLTRFESLEQNNNFAFIRATKSDDNRSGAANDIVKRLTEGSSTNDCKQITILEMGNAEDEAVELVSAVLSRIMFRSLKQLPERGSRPVHLILEEAHRYVAQRPSEFAIDASRIFERIAKEGRKYGMFLMLASQRPSELSKTVLSQCANFIIHRIQNPDDLNHIRQMTPFISKNVLDRLPSLPQQFALIFGSAVNIHMTFKVRTANPVPKSEDSMIVKHWYPTTDVNGDGEGIS